MTASVNAASNRSLPAFSAKAARYFNCAAMVGSVFAFAARSRLGP
ncbi:hypothetical protein [Streptomyces hokutonensis]|nr:hypothetical protein [Streptomyces hokutonensis]